MSDDEFPKYFLFGAATSAYQVEGGWNMDGRGPSVWDTLTHEHPNLIADGQNGDTGPDSYHFFEEDIKALKSIGVSVDSVSKIERAIQLRHCSISDEFLSILDLMVTNIADRRYCKHKRSWYPILQ